MNEEISPELESQFNELAQSMEAMAVAHSAVMSNMTLAMDIILSINKSDDVSFHSDVRPMMRHWLKLLEAHDIEVRQAYRMFFDSYDTAHQLSFDFISDEEE